MDTEILQGDCVAVMRELPDGCVDAIVTDPPYGIGFMGHEWDQPDHRGSAAHGYSETQGDGRPHPAMEAGRYDVSRSGNATFQRWVEWWAREALRVAKPGAYLLVCGSPRTFHRMTSGLEDAGWEIRDCLSWLYGSGFPKSLNVGGGRGTALKPGWEPVVVARKPLGSTVAACVATHGTGAINVDACRLAFESAADESAAKAKNQHGAFGSGPMTNQIYGTFDKPRTDYDAAGRWPPNVALDEEAAGMLNGQARFFYVAKASRSEREAGCASLPARSGADAVKREEGTAGTRSPRAGAGRTATEVRNHHPTVKPVALMRWLVRLVTPVDGVVLDPFAGSGTTGVAAVAEGRGFLGIDREADYVAIARARLAHAGVSVSLSNFASDREEAEVANAKRCLDWCVANAAVVVFEAPDKVVVMKERGDMTAQAQGATLDEAIAKLASLLDPTAPPWDGVVSGPTARSTPPRRSALDRAIPWRRARSSTTWSRRPRPRRAPSSRPAGRPASSARPRTATSPCSPRRSPRPRTRRARSSWSPRSRRPESRASGGPSSSPPRLARETTTEDRGPLLQTGGGRRGL